MKMRIVYLGCMLSLHFVLQLNYLKTEEARVWGSFKSNEGRRGMEDFLMNTPWQMPRYAFEDITTETDFGLYSGSSYMRPPAQRNYKDRMQERERKHIQTPWLQRAKRFFNNTRRGLTLPAIQTVGATLFLIFSWYFVRSGVKQYFVSLYSLALIRVH